MLTIKIDESSYSLKRNIADTKEDMERVRDLGDLQLDNVQEYEQAVSNLIDNLSYLLNQLDEGEEIK